jgi:hypothetical protein
MSRNVMINTPLYIMTKIGIRKLITFEDLFCICREDTKYFKRLAAEPDKLVEILDERRLVLTYACYNALINLVKTPGAVADALRLLGRGEWPPAEPSSGAIKPRRMVMSLGGEPGGTQPPCIWPDCP